MAQILSYQKMIMLATTVMGTDSRMDCTTRGNMTKKNDAPDGSQTGCRSVDLDMDEYADVGCLLFRSGKHNG